MRSNIFSIFIFICFSRIIGFVLFPFILKTSPVLLIILSPFIHHLMLTSTLINAPLFLFLGIIVSFFQCSIGYEFGKKHGVVGVEWMEKHRILSQSQVGLITRLLRYSAPLILFLIPGPFVAMVAGVARVAPKLFYAVMIPSQILWIVACLFLGEELEVYLTIIKNFVIKNGIAITCGLILIKFIQTWCKKRGT